tara:strand:- start:54 stop:1079 length:1026 start_codon:yes stop_codon:yes gene_type:complete
MLKENLSIISNEKTTKDKHNFFCDNIDTKSLSEGLSNDFEIKLFVRNSKTLRTAYKINQKNIVMSKNILVYILNILKSLSFSEKYLIISLSPYTFTICVLLSILRKKVYVYLRSNGYEEYKCYSKYFGPFIYHIMFSIASLSSNLIACRKHLLKEKKGELVSPSQLNEKWFDNRKSPDLKKIKLLYVGRIRIEKGIFSLLKILKEIKLDFTITIINPEKFYDKKLENDKVKIVHFKKDHESLMEIYDDHNVFILPSYTEGHPQVLDESLSRLRPVIIFPEISHVTRDREGVFISERNSESLSNKIKFVMNNHKDIQQKMMSNKLRTKFFFLNEMTRIIGQR